MMHEKPDNAGTLRHTLKVLAAVAFGFLIYAILAQVSGYLTIRDFSPDIGSQLAFLLIKVWLPWLIFSPVMVYVATRFSINPDNWMRLSAIHLAIFLLLSLLSVTVTSYYYHYATNMNHDMAQYLPWQHVGHFLFGDSIFLYNAIVYTVLIASFNLRNFYNIAQQQELSASQLTQKLTESQLKALRMQVNPHFLFNTLNVISVLVMKKENAKAGEMIERLSGFFRQTLEDSKSQWVALKTELEMTSQYLAIEQVRFGDRLTVVENIADDVLAVSVPPMILQPLVENAMRHGLGEKEGPGTITIESKRMADRLLIRISDDGAGCIFGGREGVKLGVGLTNVQERLQQIYGDDHVFSLVGQPGKGVTISIELPVPLNVEDN
ncbi:MAG: two-component system LytT family sensor kinase [Oceanicoccus sp.]|jgi:two-component system LytT family sensor kinase